MVLALTTEHKVLLAGMGAIFIVFALVSAFFIPRSRPDFPGRRLWPFVIASIVLFVAMMLAVEFFAVEEEEAEAGGREVAVAATEFELEPAREDVEPGEHVFRLTNVGQTGHNLVIEGPGVKREATPVIEPGKSADLDVELRRGSYTLYCSVPGHREAGMETTVEVR